ncbi:MAG: ABC transporter ATP-binding protein [Dehalococcoidales bacterium]|nr:ABC transporter ATP-binding protein [Dehalococcoidales bacterium]
MSEATGIISLNSITKIYKDFTAVNGVNLQIKQGEILGIIGHNGAGKTTTIKMMIGLLAPTSGEITVMGKDMSRESTKVKQHIGYLPEESPLYENMTIRQYLEFFGELYKLKKKKVAERIETLLTSLKLEERDKYTGDLSKGMRRKVAIARTLLHEPSILVLDEPNSGLDPLTSFFIIDYLKKLNAEGTTIVLSAHNLFHVEYICDRVAIMKNGEIYLCDTIDAIRQKLGKREYEVVFSADKELDYPKQGENYVFTTADVAKIAALLHDISENGWALIDLSVRQSALEDMYVKLMGEGVDP